MRVEDELLLLAVSAAIAAHRARLGELLRAADVERLIAELRRLRVLPVLGERIAAHVEIPAALRAAIDEDRRTNALHGMLAEALVQELTRAFDARGIPLLPLKGQALAAEAHGAGDMRDSTDIDVLVPVERLFDAARLLEELGYRVSSTGPDLPSLHVMAAHRTQARPAVELHWRIHWYERDWSRRLLDTSVPGPDGVRRAAPPLALMALLAYHARDAFAGLRLLADIVGYAERHPELLAGDAVAQEVARTPALAPAVHAAAAAVRAVSGLHIPGLGERLTRRQRLAVRLADPWQRSSFDQRIAVTHLVDGLLTPPGGMRAYLGERLTMFPTPRENALHLAKTGVRWVGALRPGAPTVPVRRPPRS